LLSSFHNGTVGAELGIKIIQKEESIERIKTETERRKRKGGKDRNKSRKEEEDRKQRNREVKQRRKQKREMQKRFLQPLGKMTRDSLKLRIPLVLPDELCHASASPRPHPFVWGQFLLIPCSTTRFSL
jgi:hypothetical protein